MNELIAEFESMKRRYPPGTESSLVLPCLRRIQEQRGFIADSDIAELTAYLGVPRVQIEEVIGHYTQYRRQPVGHWHLQVCHNVSCSLRGAERVLKQIGQTLGIEPGQTTADGRFTLSTVECLGSCGTAPVLIVGETYHENMDPQRLDALLQDLQARPGEPS